MLQSSIFSLASFDSLDTQKFTVPTTLRSTAVRNQIKMIQLKCSAQWTLIVVFFFGIGGGIIIVEEGH